MPVETRTTCKHTFGRLLRDGIIPFEILLEIFSFGTSLEKVRWGQTNRLLRDVFHNSLLISLLTSDGDGDGDEGGIKFEADLLGSKNLKVTMQLNMASNSTEKNSGVSGSSSRDSVLRFTSKDKFTTKVLSNYGQNHLAYPIARHFDLRKTKSILFYSPNHGTEINDRMLLTQLRGIPVRSMIGTRVGWEATAAYYPSYNVKKEAKRLKEWHDREAQKEMKKRRGKKRKRDCNSDDKTCSSNGDVFMDDVKPVTESKLLCQLQKISKRASAKIHNKPLKKLCKARHTAELSLKNVLNCDRPKRLFHYLAADVYRNIKARNKANDGFSIDPLLIDNSKDYKDIGKEQTLYHGIMMKYHHCHPSDMNCSNGGEVRTLVKTTQDNYNGFKSSVSYFVQNLLQNGIDETPMVLCTRSTIDSAILKRPDEEADLEEEADASEFRRAQIRHLSRRRRDRTIYNVPSAEYEDQVPRRQLGVLPFGDISDSMYSGKRYGETELQCQMILDIPPLYNDRIMHGDSRLAHAANIGKGSGEGTCDIDTVDDHVESLRKMNKNTIGVTRRRIDLSMKYTSIGKWPYVVPEGRP